MWSCIAVERNGVGQHHGVGVAMREVVRTPKYVADLVVNSHWGVAKGCPTQECAIKRDAAVSFIVRIGDRARQRARHRADGLLGDEPHDGRDLWRIERLHSMSERVQTTGSS